MATIISYVFFKSGNSPSERTCVGTLTLGGPLPSAPTVAVWRFMNLQGKITIAAAQGRAYSNPDGFKLCDMVPSSVCYSAPAVALADLLAGKIETLPLTGRDQSRWEMSPAGQPITVADTEFAGFGVNGVNPNPQPTQTTPTTRPQPRGPVMQPIPDDIFNKLPGINPNWRP